MNLTLLQSIYSHPLLQASDLESLFKAHIKVKFKKGDLILKAGDVSGEYYIIETGLMRSYVNDYENNEITTNFFGDNEIAIEVLSLFQKIPSQESIQALTDCECYQIDFNTFQDFFRNLPGFSEWGRAWFTMSLFSMKQRSLSIITIDAKNRYLKLLKEKPMVAKYAPLKYIATFLGIADTSLSRIRKEISHS
jgi:CRP/FNR family transcriptional regulator, anaerobic regulatory protein